MKLTELTDNLLGHLDVKSPEKKYVKRLNPSNDNVPFFSLIRPEEEKSGPYSDMSFVVFPDDATEVGRCIVSLVIGSRGFRNDYDIARLPWWRREFLTLDGAVCKVRFTDMESELDIFDGFSDVKDTYGKCVMAARTVDMTEPDALNILYDWLDTYAYLRGWIKQPSKNKKATRRRTPDIKKLLDNYKYVVLQGAPGVGKTFNANKIADQYDREHVHFIQFHAETTYADFVEGLEPNTNGAPGFKRKEGVLLKAIRDARKDSSKKVLLIIDEINRANLSNVLGPVFFLFERDADYRTIGIEIDGEILQHLPSNLHVLATMNSADRSLAVVDFALRRRFVWVTLSPIPLSSPNFYKDAFEDMSQIFRRYADDSELALQPGQSYFLADTDTALEERIRYELLPLIKEYLNEGFLRNAESAFASYFVRHAGGASLYE